MAAQLARRRGPALLVALLVAMAAAEGADLPPLISSRPGNVHALLLTDCAKYQDWQTIAGAFAWRESGQPGAITRVANCNEKDRANYSQAMLAYVDTLMAPEVRARAHGPHAARMPVCPHGTRRGPPCNQRLRPAGRRGVRRRYARHPAAARGRAPAEAAAN
jgi:hypothetical protein